MMLDSAKEFIEIFLDKEFEIIKLISLEPDREKVHAEFKIFLSFFVKGARKDPSIVLNEDIDKKWENEGKDRLKRKSRRKLFQIKEYSHTDLGSIYRCYMSDLNVPYQNEYEYFQNYFVAKINNDFKIISTYGLKIRDVDEDRELSVGLKDFRYFSGVEFKKLDKPIDILKIFPPVKPNHLAEYNKE
jgi:hypothetical protein